MGIVRFSFDKEEDLKNIWETANSDISYGANFRKQLTENILEICENKKYSACKKKLEKETSPFHKNPLLTSAPIYIGQSWDKIEKEYFKRLEKITKMNFPFKKVNAYLTTAGRCPYNPHSRPPSFYFNFFASLPNQLYITGHELMHIHLHNIDWWKKVETQIGYDKTHDLKEAVAVILDLEFSDLWLVQGKGYPNHTKLMNYISRKWKEEKDFDKLTEDCIKWIKRNGIK